MIDAATVIGAIAALLAAWLVVVQLVYQKRREDTQAVKEGLSALSRVAHLALMQRIGRGDNEAGWQAGHDMHLLLSIEMRHRSRGVQEELVKFWMRAEGIADTAAGEGDPLSVEEIGNREVELTQTLLSALGNLTTFECLLELGALPGPDSLPEWATRRPKPPRKEPTLA